MIAQAVMAFGGGVLISALSFDLIDKSIPGVADSIPLDGFLAGAAVYAGATSYLDRRGARHRKRWGGQQPSERRTGQWQCIAISVLNHGVPESDRHRRQHDHRAAQSAWFPLLRSSCPTS